MPNGHGGKDKKKILIFLVVVCVLALIALAAVDLLIKRVSDGGSGTQKNGTGSQNSNQGNGGQPGNTGATGNNVEPVGNTGGNSSNNTNTGTGTNTTTGTGTGGNSGGNRQPVTQTGEPLDKPPDPSIKVELVKTYIETFVRDHTMLEQVQPTELSGNYFPPNTELLGVHVHGMSVTMDFSNEILAFSARPDIFDQWQKELITSIYDIAPTLANFHVRVMDEKGTLQPLNYYLKIPPEKKPRDK